MKTETILQVEGNTNDLLQISAANNLKRTSLIYFNPLSREAGEEVITLSIDSSNEALTFPIFDKIMDKKIRITVEVIGDEEESMNKILKEICKS